MNTQNLNQNTTNTNKNTQTNTTNNDLPINVDVPQLPNDSNNSNSINNQTPELPDSFEMPEVPALPELDNIIIEQNTGNKTESTNNDPFADLNNLGLDLPSPYQP